VAKRTLTVFITTGIILIAGIWISAISIAAPDGQSEQPLPGLMLAKLASSQTIVAGLVSKDFDQIRRGAQDMVRICDATQWESNADDTYVQYRSELRRQAVRLTQLAGEENLEGAAFVYMHSMSTCINCHQHCRDVLRIADRRPNQGGVILIPTTESGVSWPGQEFRR
jgi:hypothetical protein